VNPDNTGLKPNKDEPNQLNVTNNLRVIPGTVGDLEIGVKYLFDTPVYWQLPKRFTGDKVVIKNTMIKIRMYNYIYYLDSFIRWLHTVHH